MPPENIHVIPPRPNLTPGMIIRNNMAVLWLMAGVGDLEDFADIAAAQPELVDGPFEFAGYPEQAAQLRRDVERLRWRGFHVRLSVHGTGEILEPTPCPPLDMLTTEEAEQATVEFLKRRGKRGASREEIETIVKNADDLKMKHHTYLVLKAGRVLTDVVDGQLVYMTPEQYQQRYHPEAKETA